MITSVAHKHTRRLRLRHNYRYPCYIVICFYYWCNACLLPEARRNFLSGPETARCVQSLASSWQTNTDRILNYTHFSLVLGQTPSSEIQHNVCGNLTGWITCAAAVAGRNIRAAAMESEMNQVHVREWVEYILSYLRNVCSINFPHWRWFNLNIISKWKRNNNRCKR